ncbi:cytochrome c5 family protein [Alcanivorax sp. IO_7]|nr:cytochrome c5 family protein [Alcanivorax sp. IO_7]
MKGLIAGLALTLALGLTTGAQADAVKERYDQSCTYCHSSGARAQDRGPGRLETAPRERHGHAGQTRQRGLQRDAAGGMCGDCSDEEYRALIEYMSK